MEPIARAALQSLALVARTCLVSASGVSRVCLGAIILVRLGARHAKDADNVREHHGSMFTY